uniref:Uncharacterized protein n=1 Tax=Romanomermis culicivorax TaxID=13658 RepID=A0A915I6K3_ROMCU
MHVVPFLLSTTEEAVDCLLALPLLPYTTPLPTVTTVHFRINKYFLKNADYFMDDVYSDTIQQVYLFA